MKTTIVLAAFPFVFGLLVAVNSGLAQTGGQAGGGQAAGPTDQVKALAAQLGSGESAVRDKALVQLRGMDGDSPGELADGFLILIPPLMQAKAYDDLEQFATTAIITKSSVLPTVYPAEKAKVQALLSQNKSDETLAEAKAYYNVASLQATGEAIDFLAQALAKSRGSAIAAQFKAQQLVSGSSTQPSDAHDADILKAIKLDASAYAGGLKAFESQKEKLSSSQRNLVSWGNLLLLSDRPADAKRCFLAACVKANNSPRQTRESVEGVARAIRAENENASPADAFIKALRQPMYPTDATPEAVQLYSAAGVDPDKVRLAAQQTVLADLSANAGH